MRPATSINRLLLMILLVMPTVTVGNVSSYRSSLARSPANSVLFDWSPHQVVTQASGQNLSSYYCPNPPEERVYVNLAGDRFNQAFSSVGLGALVIWSGYGNPLPTSSHTVTANTTANGPSLPFFNATVRPLDQFPYTFTVPGTYYYYDKYVPSNKGVITVHPRNLVGNSLLAVNSDGPNSIQNKFNVTGPTFSINVVATNAASLSRFEICLQYDTNTSVENSLSFSPSWDASYNSNALGTGSIYTGDGFIRADSYMIDGSPGGNATGITRLFSVAFNAQNFGYGNLQLTGYLIDSNGNYISYVRQNGLYRVIPPAALFYEALYLGHPVPGATITINNVFENVGQSQDRVSSAQITTDFGTYSQTTGLPLNITSLTNATLTMPMAIPSTASLGVHHLTGSAMWEYLRTNSTSGTSSWVTGPAITGSGTITIRSPVPPASKPTSTIADLLIKDWRLLAIGAAIVWIALTIGAIGMILTVKKKPALPLTWANVSQGIDKS